MCLIAQDPVSAMAGKFHTHHPFSLSALLTHHMVSLPHPDGAHAAPVQNGASAAAAAAGSLNITLREQWQKEA